MRKLQPSFFHRSDEKDSATLNIKGIENASQHSYEVLKKAEAHSVYNTITQEQKLVHKQSIQFKQRDFHADYLNLLGYNNVRDYLKNPYDPKATEASVVTTAN